MRGKWNLALLSDCSLWPHASCCPQIVPSPPSECAVEAVAHPSPAALGLSDPVGSVLFLPAMKVELPHIGKLASSLLAFLPPGMLVNALPAFAPLTAGRDKRPATHLPRFACADGTLRRHLHECRLVGVPAAVIVNQPPYWRFKRKTNRRRTGQQQTSGSEVFGLLSGGTKARTVPCSPSLLSDPIAARTTGCTPRTPSGETTFWRLRRS